MVILKKINFSGGEPLLCSWLDNLIIYAKSLGFITSVVTNGSLITESWLQSINKHLDWIGLSIDSINSQTNIKAGRFLKRIEMNYDYYLKLSNLINQYKINLKVNTVVHKLNFKENIYEFIDQIKPKRWKILQVLQIKNENDKNIDNFKITEEELEFYVKNNSLSNLITNVVIEPNNLMKGSYVMIDPAGRFFDNTTGFHKYSKPILEVGSHFAIQEMDYNFSKFVKRGGNYNWNLNENTFPKRISLSGEVASGKSTVGKLLAKKLNYTFTSIGNKTRRFAEQKKMSIVEFQKECLKNPKLDKKIDKEFSSECNALDNLVIDYRLGFHFIKDSFNIYLKILEKEAIKRLIIANRENETHHTLQERNDSFKQQFMNNYNVDFQDEKNYDLILNVKNKDPDDIVNEILEYMSFKLNK